VDQRVASIGPAARELDEQEEVELGRICYVLALFEEVYRAGLWPGSPLSSQAMTSLDALLSAVPHLATEDISMLAAAMYPIWLPLTGLPFDLNPKFDGSADVRGADAGLIVDGVLVDIKTKTKANLDKLTVFQLLGYLFLDYSNHYDINELALYYSRTAEFVRLPISTAFELAATDTSKSLAQYRSELQKILA
jgi:hypothetical protein